MRKFILDNRALITAIGGGLGIVLMVALAAASGSALEAVPFTTSIVLVMSAPDSAQAQPRNILGGHLLSALSGLLVASLLGHSPWLAGLAVALAIAAMQITRTLHPPAGINALLIVVMNLPWTFVVFPVAIGAAILILFAFAYHRVTQTDWPRSWWRPV